MNTAGTVGVVRVDVAAWWWWQWARAWADLGELAERVRDNGPLFLHSPSPGLPCDCFECRAARAFAAAVEKAGF